MRPKAGGSSLHGAAVLTPKTTYTWDTGDPSGFSQLSTYDSNQFNFPNFQKFFLTDNWQYYINASGTGSTAAKPFGNGSSLILQRGGTFKSTDLDITYSSAGTNSHFDLPAGTYFIATAFLGTGITTYNITVTNGSVLEAANSAPVTTQTTAASEDTYVINDGGGSLDFSFAAATTITYARIKFKPLVTKEPNDRGLIKRYAVNGLQILAQWTGPTIDNGGSVSITQIQPHAENDLLVGDTVQTETTLHRYENMSKTTYTNYHNRIELGAQGHWRPNSIDEIKLRSCTEWVEADMGELVVSGNYTSYPAATGPGSAFVRLYINMLMEAESYDQTLDTTESNTDMAMYNEAMRLVQLCPQFTSNPDHLKQIGRFFKHIGMSLDHLLNRVTNRVGHYIGNLTQGLGQLQGAASQFEQLYHLAGSIA